jgi:hypothetical protein
MRKVLLALATSAVVFTGGMSAAAARDYPYCIQGEDYAGGAGECGFTTIAQCRRPLQAGWLIAQPTPRLLPARRSPTEAARITTRTETGGGDWPRKTTAAPVRGADRGRVEHRVAPRFATRCGSSLNGHDLIPKSGHARKIRTAAARPSPVNRNAAVARP